MKPDLFEAPDYYNLDDLFSEEHKLVRDAAREWVKRAVSPIIESYAQKAEFPEQIIGGLAEIGAFGPYIPETYGGAGLDQISYGLIMQEIERGDSGVRSTASVQSSLVMYPIWQYGNEEQRQKYLPKLATGEFMGAFGLTEPDHGSNPGGMTTNYKDMGDHYLLNGAKLWISNAPFCDLAVVWAKNDEGRIHGLIVERGMEGFSTPETHNKWSLRASATGELIFQDVKVPKENRIGEDGFGFKFAMKTLSGGRIGIAAQALGIASGAYELALKYSQERKAFGTEIFNHQAIAFKLADMYTDITAARHLVMQAACDKDSGNNYDRSGAMAKLYASKVAMEHTVEAVQINGGNGFVKEYHVERLMRDAKITQIYEGTSEIQKIVISRSLIKE